MDILKIVSFLIVFEEAFIVHRRFYHGVPMILIPVFAEQMRNVNIMVHKNLGILMRSDDINEHSTDVALDALLHDPKHRQQQLSFYNKDWRRNVIISITDNEITK